MCIPIPHETGHTMQSGLKQGIPDSYKPCRTEPPKMHICSNFDFKAHLRRVYASMVHLTYNAAKRRKMPIECKIELYTRYHSEMPCYFVPCYSVQIRANGSRYARFLSIGIRWTSTEPHGFFPMKREQLGAVQPIPDRADRLSPIRS